MRRRINWKAVVILSVLLALVLPGGFFLHRYQVRANSRALLDQADLTHKAREALTSGQGEAPEGEVIKLLNKEIDYLRRYLGFNPRESTRVLERYGMLLADERVATTPMSRFRALTVLEQVVGRGEDKPELRRKVVDLAMSVGRFSDAASHLNHLLPRNLRAARAENDPDDPPATDDPELRGLRGRCYFEIGQFAAAREDYEKAVRMPNAPAETYAQLAVLLRTEAAPLTQESRESIADLSAQADYHIDQMVVNRPEDYKARLARADYMRAYGLTAGAASVLDAAQVDVDEAVRFGQDQPEVLLALADLAMARRAPDLARVYLATGISKHPKNTRLYIALANLERAAGRLTESAKVLRQGLVKLPLDADMLWALADVLVESKSAEADAVITKVGLAGVGPTEIGVLKARQLANAENWEQAIKTLQVSFEGLRGQLGRGRDSFRLELAKQAGLLLGTYHERTGDHDLAHDAYRLVLEAVDGNSMKALIGMARARKNAGRQKEALAEYTRLASLPGGPGFALVERARLTLQLNMKKQDPDWREVETALSAAESRLQPPPVDLVLLRLEMLAQQAGRLGEAEAYFDRLLNTFLLAPVRFDALMKWPLQAEARLPLFFYVAKAYLNDAEGTGLAAESARLLLEEARRVHGDSTSLREARIRHWATVNDAEAAKRALAEVEREVGNLSSRAERRALFQVLATAYQRRLDSEGAKRVWLQVAKENPEDIPSRLALFDFALKADDDAKMREQIEALKKIELEDRGIQWRYAEVRRLLLRASREEQGREARLAEAEALLKVIIPRRPEWSRAVLAEAQIADLRGRQEKVALEKYLQAIGQGERSVAIIQRAVYLSWKLNRDPTERNRLLSNLDDIDRHGLMTQIEVEDALSAGNIDTALKLAERDAQELEKNKSTPAGAAAAYAHLGLVYQRKAQLEKSEDAVKKVLAQAEAAFRKATELDKKSVIAWNGLVLFLARSNPDEARKALARLEELTTNPVTLAPCYEAVGQTQKAEQGFATVVKNRPGDAAPLDALVWFYLRQGQPSKALPHMEKLVNNFSTTREAQGIRPMLALLQLRTSTYQKAMEALQGLGSPDGLRAGADVRAAGDQRARAVILAELPGRENRAQAIKLLTDLVIKGRSLPSDHLALARLHERQGDWKNTRLHLLALEATGGGNAALALAPLIRGLLNQKDVSEARRAMERLEKVDPRSIVTAEVKARLLHAENRTDDAVKHLKTALRGQETLANLGLAATALESMGRIAEAEALYQRIVVLGKNNPKTLQALVSFYSRQKEAKKALDLCDKVWEMGRSAEAANLSLIILSAMPRDAEVLRRVDGQLSKAQKAAPGDAGLIAALGHLRVMQERYPEAEKLYVEALETDSKNVITKNNLAWLLALQPGRAERAKELTQQAIDQIGPRPWLLDTQGVAHLTLGESAEALARLKEATEEDPTPISKFHYAWALHQANRSTEARAKLQEALSAGLKDADLHPLERPTLARLCKVLGVTPPSP